MNSPVQDRLQVSSPDGVLTPSGVATFRRVFSGAESAERFHSWADNPVTKLVTSALRDLALNGPVGMGSQPEGYAIQYGMTLGLQLAAQLVSDPSLVFPEVFRGVPEASRLAPEMTFDTAPENF